jgi:hypothetical protein
MTISAGFPKLMSWGGRPEFPNPRREEPFELGSVMRLSPIGGGLFKVVSSERLESPDRNQSNFGVLCWVK